VPVEVGEAALVRPALVQRAGLAL